MPLNRAPDIDPEKCIGHFRPPKPEDTSQLRTMLTIRRDEWVAWDWIEVTEFKDSERQFIRGRERTPDEGARAASEWDTWFYSAKTQLKGLKDETEPKS